MSSVLCCQPTVHGSANCLLQIHGVAPARCIIAQQAAFTVGGMANISKCTNGKSQGSDTVRHKQIWWRVKIMLQVRSQRAKEMIA